MNELERVYHTFFNPGEITEIRAFGLTGKSNYYSGYAGKKSVVSGYFDNAADFAWAAKNLDASKAKGVHFTVNLLDKSLFARAPNQLVAAPDSTTSDQNITTIRWFFCDIDPKRASGVSSTNAEMEAAKAVASDVAHWLEKGSLKFPKGLRAWSGNGYHVLYRLPDLPANKETIALIRDALRATEHEFRSETVAVDTAVGNPARMVKVYGTYARKGYSTEDRPHRKSGLFPDQPEVLADVPVVPLESFKKLAAMAPEEGNYPVSGTAETGQAKPLKAKATFDMEAYLGHYQVPFSLKKEGIKNIYRLERCLFDESHGKNEAAIIQSPEPPYLAYHCMHTSCKNKTWKDAKAKVSGADNLARFMSNYDPNWKPGGFGGQTGQFANITVSACSVPPGDGAADIPTPLDVNPWEFFSRTGKRPNFVPRLLANYLIAYLRHVAYIDGMYWRYADGVWRSFGRDLIEHICTLALKDEASSNRIDNAVRVFRGLVSLTKEKWPRDQKYINCANGMVNLKTGELVAHHPGYGSKIQIAAAYNPDATCERWLQFLREVFPEDEETKNKKKGKKSELLRQFFGYCLLPDCRFQKSMFLYGPGSNGKSTALNALIDVIGTENTSSLTINDLSQRFKAQFLENKLVNVATETNSRDPIGTEMYKAAVRGEPITAERKYGEPYLFIPTAKWLVAMNESPVIPDKSYGFVRSVLVLNFARRFGKDEIDTTLGEKLHEERDGIFMWALLGLKAVLDNNGFEIPEAVEEESDEFMKSLNPALIYIEESCDLDPEDEVGSVELFKNYRQWCVDGGYRPLSRNKFIDQILSNFPGVTRDNHIYGGNTRGFRGLGLKFEL